MYTLDLVPPSGGLKEVSLKAKQWDYLEQTLQKKHLKSAWRTLNNASKQAGILNKI